jgi:hypothetical protein
VTSLGRGYKADTNLCLRKLSYPANCHPEEVESFAKRRTPDEGPLQVADSANAAGDSIGPFDLQKARTGSRLLKKAGSYQDIALAISQDL